MSGWRERIVGQGRLYAGANDVRNVFRIIEWMTDLLLPHREHWPSRILLQTMCVADHFLHLLAFLE